MLPLLLICSHEGWSGHITSLPLSFQFSHGLLSRLADRLGVIWSWCDGECEERAQIGAEPGMHWPVNTWLVVNISVQAESWIRIKVNDNNNHRNFIWCVVLVKSDQMKTYLNLQISSICGCYVMAFPTGLYVLRLRLSLRHSQQFNLNFQSDNISRHHLC